MTEDGFFAFIQVYRGRPKFYVKEFIMRYTVEAQQGKIGNGCFHFFLKINNDLF